MITLVLITITVKSQTTNDSIQIKQAALDYVEGWFYKDANRIDNAVHFEFVKRSILTIDSIDFLGTINKSRMVLITLYHRNREYSLYTEVFILDAMPTIASVKVIFNECIEYLHIAKLNDKWKIVNNLFTGNPDFKRKK
ncbi:MAG: nuclear transport factor 2 family protein [Bacteroidales bacterium]|nr:nuclear transport factor 2 family protein [Bacteroidales bacterium]